MRRGGRICFVHPSHLAILLCWTVVAPTPETVGVDIGLLNEYPQATTGVPPYVGAPVVGNQVVTIQVTVEVDLLFVDPTGLRINITSPDPNLFAPHGISPISGNPTYFTYAGEGYLPGTGYFNDTENVWHIGTIALGSEYAIFLNATVAPGVSLGGNPYPVYAELYWGGETTLDFFSDSFATVYFYSAEVPETSGPTPSPTNGPTAAPIDAPTVAPTPPTASPTTYPSSNPTPEIPPLVACELELAIGDDDYQQTGCAGNPAHDGPVVIVLNQNTLLL